MRRVSMLAIGLGVLLVQSGISETKSGLGVGDTVKAFAPKHLTGDDAGKTSCIVCKCGDSPVVAIFAREMDDNLLSLAKKIDEATAKNKAKEMGSFVIFLDKSEEMEKKAKGFGEKAGLKQTVIALDKTEGPKGYGIAKDASVTVMLYVERTVKASFSFEKGKLAAADVEKIVSELPKILAN